MSADDTSAAKELSGPPVPPIAKILVLLAVQALAMVAIGLGLWQLSRRPLTGFVTFSAQEASWGLALGLGLIILAFALFRGLPRIGEALVRLQADAYGVIGTRIGLPAVIFIAICAGVGEEALFRGGLQTLLGDLIGAPAAILVSSTAFAGAHLAKPVITLLVLLVGAIFGAVFWYTDSLLTVMVGHALYDVWALRYLLREFERLGLDRGQAAPLVNPVGES